MKVKVCFNQEIHIISKLPKSLNELRSILSATFISALPINWHLKYLDELKRHLTIFTEEDYMMFMATSQKITKIYLVPDEEESLIQSELESQSQFLSARKEKDLSQQQEFNKEVLEKVEHLYNLMKTTENDVHQLTISQQKENLEKLSKQIESQQQLNEDTIEEIVERIITKSIPKIASATHVLLSESSLKPSEEVRRHSQQQSVKHHGIVCQGCGVSPILGVRYKCSVCREFDYCEACEDKEAHSHAFIKIRDPRQPYEHACNRYLAYTKAHALQKKKYDRHIHHQRNKLSTKLNPNLFIQKLKESPEGLDIIFKFFGGSIEGLRPYQVVQKLKHTKEGNEIIAQYLEGKLLQLPNKECYPLARSRSRSVSQAKSKPKSRSKSRKCNEAAGEIQSFFRQYLKQKRTKFIQSLKNESNQNDLVLVNQEEKFAPVTWKYTDRQLEMAESLHELLPSADYNKILEFCARCPADMDIVEMMERFQLN